MNYQDTEQSIVTRLAPLAGVGISVAVLPDVQADFKSSVGPQVWVTYTESTFDQTNKDPRHFSMGPTQQKEVLNFELTIQAKKLRGASGIYKLMELTRALLVGFQPSNCHKLYMIQVVPEKFEENLWTYKMIMGCQSVVLESVPEDTSALLTQLKLDSGIPNYADDELNETVVIPQPE